MERGMGTGGRRYRKRAKAWRAYLVAQRLLRLRITLPDEELLQKCCAKSIWHSTFPVGTNARAHKSSFNRHIRFFPNNRKVWQFSSSNYSHTGMVRGSGGLPCA